MREKPNSFLTQINTIRQVAASAENYSPKRLMIIFNNSKCRLKEIPGIDAKYHSDLNEITKDCLNMLEKNPKESFETYNSKLEDLLNNIIHDAFPALVPSV